MKRINPFLERIKVSISVCSTEYLHFILIKLMIKLKSSALPKIHFSVTRTSTKVIKTASNSNIITGPLHNKVLLINCGKLKSHSNFVLIELTFISSSSNRHSSSNCRFITQFLLHKKIHFVSITKISMVSAKVQDVYCENRTKHINTRYIDP